MKIVVEMELDAPYGLTPEEIEHDILMAEDMIGLAHYYKIESIKCIEKGVYNETRASTD